MVLDAQPLEKLIRSPARRSVLRLAGSPAAAALRQKSGRAPDGGTTGYRHNRAQHAPFRNALRRFPLKRKQASGLKLSPLPIQTALCLCGVSRPENAARAWTVPDAGHAAVLHADRNARILPRQAHGLRAGTRLNLPGIQAGPPRTMRLRWTRLLAPVLPTGLSDRAKKFFSALKLQRTLFAAACMRRDRPAHTAAPARAIRRNMLILHRAAP